MGLTLMQFSVSGRFPSYISPDEHGGSLEVRSVICTQESPKKVMKRAYPCVPVAAILKQWVWAVLGLTDPSPGPGLDCANSF